MIKTLRSDQDIEGTAMNMANPWSDGVEGQALGY
jgi:hypothetical protein